MALDYRVPSGLQLATNETMSEEMFVPSLRLIDYLRPGRPYEERLGMLNSVQVRGTGYGVDLFIRRVVNRCAIRSGNKGKFCGRSPGGTLGTKSGRCGWRLDMYTMGYPDGSVRLKDIELVHRIYPGPLNNNIRSGKQIHSAVSTEMLDNNLEKKVPS